MGNDSNKKNRRNINKQAMDRLEQKNVEIPSESEVSGFKEYTSGAAAFADFFNKMASESIRKAQKEMDKPQYRFIDSFEGDDMHADFSELIHTPKYAHIVNEISELQKKISNFNYEVQIIEDLDCKNVTEESRYYIRIAHKNGVCINIDLFEYENNIKDFNFDEQEYMEEKISRITGCINASVREIAEYTVEYLAYILYFKGLYTLTYRKIGWEYYDWNSKGWIFKYDKIYSNILFLRGRGKNKFVEGLTRSEDDGKKTWEWVEATISLINRYPMDALILGAGLSGVVRQLLPFTKETNININIVGEPASGKSTICHYLLGIFGNPELLEGSFTDTENATEERRVIRPILPYVLDDRMLKLEGESENVKKKKVLIDIFREYEGKVKERLGKQYEDQAGERTYGPIISSSVESIMHYLNQNDIGQYRRFIELNIERNDLFKNREEATRIEFLASSCFGIGIEIIVDYMFALLDDNDSEATIIVDTFNIIDKDAASFLEKRENEENARKNVLKIYGMSHSSKRFALILLSYQILRKSILYFLYRELKNLEIDSTVADKNVAELIASSNDFEMFSKGEEIVSDRSRDILEILTANLVNKLRKKSNMETNSKYVGNKLYDYVMSHTANFIVTDKFSKNNLQSLYDLKEGILGFYKINNEQSITLYYVEAFALDQFWEMTKIPEPSMIIKYCETVKEKGLSEKKSNEYGFEQYGTIQNPQKFLTKPNNKSILVGTQDKIVRFTEKIIEKKNEQEEGEK